MSDGRAEVDVCLLGIRYRNISRSGAVDHITRFVEERLPRMVCVPNADSLVRAWRDADYGDLLRGADLVLADGMGVVYASRLLGTPLKENVGGRPLLHALAAQGARRGWQFLFLGGPSIEVAQAAKQKLEAANPGLRVRTYTPPYLFDEDESARMLEVVRDAKPDVLLVCFGAPRQERWIAANLDRLNVPVSIGVGAAIDAIAGHRRLPPQFMTDLGLEWLARLAQEPRRLWRRYLFNGATFLWLVLLQRLHRAR